VEEKGIYSIEKFILARRLMYWQVYLHKTVLAADFMLSNILRRSKYLGEQGSDLFATPALNRFLQNPVKGKEMLCREDCLETFSQLDDFDIFSAMKVWSTHPDPILSLLCKHLVDRHLFRAELRNQPFDPAYVATIRESAANSFGIKPEDTGYLVTEEAVSNESYNPDHDRIKIRTRDGELLDISKSSDQLNISILSTRTKKYLLAYPKELTVR
jgi:hypothetical protein